MLTTEDGSPITSDIKNFQALSNEYDKIHTRYARKSDIYERELNLKYGPGSKTYHFAISIDGKEFNLALRPKENYDDFQFGGVVKQSSTVNEVSFLITPTDFEGQILTDNIDLVISKCEYSDSSIDCDVDASRSDSFVHDDDLSNDMILSEREISPANLFAAKPYINRDHSDVMNLRILFRVDNDIWYSERLRNHLSTCINIAEEKINTLVEKSVGKRVKFTFLFEKFDLDRICSGYRNHRRFIDLNEMMTCANANPANVFHSRMNGKAVFVRDTEFDIQIAVRMHPQDSKRSLRALLGLAETGQICIKANPTVCLSLQRPENKGFFSGVILAHEIAHVLHLKHGQHYSAFI